MLFDFLVASKRFFVLKNHDAFFTAMGQNSTSRVSTSREMEKSRARLKLSKISLFRKIPREDPLLVASGIEPCYMDVGYILC